MTRKFTFLLMALLALTGFKSWGQMDVVIGTGTSTTGVYPFNGMYNYSYSEMLYGAEEIGVAGNITAISFNASNATSKSIDFDLDIYMKNVSRTTHTSNSDWETVSESDKVCHATLSGYTTGWITFTLDEPFEYDGTSTLMIAFDHNTGDYSSKSFYSHTSENHNSLCKYLDGSNIDPSDPAATVGASTNFSGTRPNIKINITPTGLASHTITYVQPDNGSISGPAEAYEGRPVTLTATPDANYALGQFFVNGSPIEGNTFIMPASDVTVTATFAHLETLTVNNGTEPNNYIPIYGYYCDASNQHNQFIIPAEQLADINGGTISSMTFYLSSPAPGAWGRTWTVKLMETTETTISSLINVSSATSVYTGVLNGQSSTMEVPFSTPYAYNGGNLLVDFSYSGGSGSYKSASFYGISTTYNSSYYNYNTTSGGPQQFLPKTTFDYVPNPNLHHITVTQPAEGGTISAPAAAISGDVVTLTATPELGYAFGEWITTPAVEIIDNQFVMPSTDVTITATFSTVTMYAITFTGIDETIISVAAKYNGETITEAQEGIEVTLEHTMLSDEYGFRNWIVNGETLTGNTFTMPAESVEIGVNLAELDTWTVCDGTSTNNGLPIYGIYADTDGTKCQFIIPAAKLEAMTDGVLASMKFYFKELGNPDNLPLATWKGYVKEVDYIDMSSGFDSAEGATTVFIGHVNTCDNETAMKIDFVEPYTYNGGNLLIGFDLVQKNSSYPSTTFCGEAQDYVSGRYKSNTAKFIPKTTFAFIPDPNRHSVTVNQPVGGTIAASPMAGILPGTSVTLTATPNFGYEFDAWIVKDADEQDVDVTETEGVYTFEMPASDVTVTATFNALQQYDITFVGVDETLITVAAKYNNETINNAPAGTEVTLEYTLLNEGYTFINWTLNGEPLDVNTFEMPANDVEIGVVLNERPRYAVIINESIAHGTVTASPNENILSGKTVTLTVTPADSYVLNTLTVTDADSNPVAVTNNQFTMPESNVTVTATFSPVLSLTVNDGTTTQPNGYGNVQIPFAGYYADGTTKSQFIIPASDLTAMIDATITDLTFYLTAPQNKDFGNAKWDICLKEVDYAAVGYSYPEEFANMTKVYSGKLSINNYLFTIHFDTPFIYGGQNLMIGFNQTTSGSYVNTTWLGAENGTDMRSRGSYSETNASFNFLPKTTFTYSNPNLHGITVNQPTEGGEIAASAGAALPGTIITLTATPEFGYEFGEWIVTPSSVTITGNTFEMPASDVTVTATFNALQQYDITFVGVDETLIGVAAKYNGETITEAPAGTEVTLQYSNLDEGYTFINWTLNGEALAGNTFEMPANDVEIGVVLNERPRYAVIIDGSIAHGTVTASPNENILSGKTVTLTVTPADSYVLNTLTVTDAESNPVAVTNNTFTMPESNVTVTATFVHGITVYDGTNTNNQVPVYGSYADSDYKSQFIFPAEDLEAMAGGIINSMTFYASEEYVAIPGTWSVYVSEVENTTLSGLEDWANLDAVLEGATITISGHQMTVNFAIPFLYNGGNLLIGFNETISGSYKSTNWYGVPQTTNTAYYWYDYSGVSEGPIQFLPKTTFLYTPVTPYTVNLHVNGVVSEEEVSILPTPENIPAGMTFCGWISSDIATYTTEAPSYVTKATADGEDFYAVFSYTEEEQTRGQNWVKITSPSELVDGEEIVLIYNDSYVMGQRSSFGTNYTRHAVEVVDGRIASMPSEANTFTLSESSGNWKLNYSDSEVGNTTLSYNTNDCLAYYGLWQSFGCDSYDVWTAEGTSKVIFRNNYNYEYIGEDESEYAELIHSVSNANLACQAFKKDVALVTYYMTEVLTNGAVANLTTNNIIVASPITISGRLEMNAEGLFRNEDAANFVFANGAEFYYTGEETVLATFQKSITGYTSTNDHYYLIANPTNNETVANLVNEEGYDLYTFDGAADLEWINMKSSPVVANDGMGYLYANSSNVTLGFAGEIIPAGSTDINLNYANKGFGGFNLIGNPFACNAYANGENFYKIAGTELSVSTGTVAPCEGIFVQATAAGQIVTLTTEAPVAAPNALCLTVSQNRGEAIDRAIVRFDECNDLHKFMLNPAHTNIRLAKNGKEFAALSTETEGEIPVSFKAEKNGSYTITVNAENVEAQYLHLIDNMTGADVDLLSTPSYTFNASTSDYAYRFKLVFDVTMDDANNGNDGMGSSFAYISNGELIISNEGRATLQVIDVMGRIVRNQQIEGDARISTEGMVAGVYVLNLNGNVQKIVVR